MCTCIIKINVGAVRIGLIDDQFYVNPSRKMVRTPLSSAQNSSRPLANLWAMHTSEWTAYDLPTSTIVASDNNCILPLLTSLTTPVPPIINQLSLPLAQLQQAKPHCGLYCWQNRYVLCHHGYYRFILTAVFNLRIHSDGGRKCQWSERGAVLWGR